METGRTPALSEMKTTFSFCGEEVSVSKLFDMVEAGKKISQQSNQYGCVGTSMYIGLAAEGMLKSAAVKYANTAGLNRHGGITVYVRRPIFTDGHLIKAREGIAMNFLRTPGWVSLSTSRTPAGTGASPLTPASWTATGRVESIICFSSSIVMSPLMTHSAGPLAQSATGRPALVVSRCVMPPASCHPMTITQMVQNRQQQRIGELAQKQQGKPHVNPYGTLFLPPICSLFNYACISTPCR